MAVKTSGHLAKLLGALFTSVVAPVLVDLAVRDIHEGTARPGGDAPPSVVVAGPPASTFAKPTDVACVIADGEGRTPDEALRAAVRAALLQALAPHVDAATRARQGQALCDALCRDADGVILGWREIGCRKEWRLTGPRHHEQVAVHLDRRALADRLRAAQDLDWSRPTR